MTTTWIDRFTVMQPGDVLMTISEDVSTLIAFLNEVRDLRKAPHREPPSEQETAKAGHAPLVMGYPNAPGCDEWGYPVQANPTLAAARAVVDEAADEVMALRDAAAALSRALAERDAAIREWQEARKPVGLDEPGVGIVEAYQAAVKRMMAAEHALAALNLDGPAGVGQTAPTESAGTHSYACTCGCPDVGGHVNVNVLEAVIREMHAQEDAKNAALTEVEFWRQAECRQAHAAVAAETALATALRERDEARAALARYEADHEKTRP